MFTCRRAAALRLAIRRLVQRPGFSAIAGVTLAPRPGELVRLGDNDNCCVNSGLQTDYALFSYDAYRHLQDQLPELTSLAAFQASSQTMGIRRTGAAITESVPGEFVSGNSFTALGVGAAGGRLLDANDDRPGADPVFVISHRVWQS